jgi:hypothetical protein
MPIPAGGIGGGDMLATADDLITLMQNPDLDVTLATLLIEAATAAVQAAADGQRIVEVQDDVVELYLDRFDHSSHLTLPQYPVTAVTAVEIGGSAVTDYVAELNRARLWRSSGWRTLDLDYIAGQPSTVSVTYTHGYPPGHQKLQLARSATLALAAQACSNPTGAVREQIDDYMVQYAEAASRMHVTPPLANALRQQYSSSAFTVRMGAG